MTASALANAVSRRTGDREEELIDGVGVVPRKPEVGIAALQSPVGRLELVPERLHLRGKRRPGHRRQRLIGQRRELSAQRALSSGKLEYRGVALLAGERAVGDGG